MNGWRKQLKLISRSWQSRNEIPIRNQIINPYSTNPSGDIFFNSLPLSMPPDTQPLWNNAITEVTWHRRLLSRGVLHYPAVTFSCAGNYKSRARVYLCWGLTLIHFQPAVIHADTNSDEMLEHADTYSYSKDNKSIWVKLSQRLLL